MKLQSKTGEHRGQNTNVEITGPGKTFYKYDIFMFYREMKVLSKQRQMENEFKLVIRA